MMKVIGGVVGGYAVMVLWIMATFSALWLVLGADTAFRPGSSQVSGAWLAGSLPLSFVGAWTGGWVAARIGGDRREQAVLGLIGLVLVLGVGSAAMAMGADPPAGPPPPGLGPFEAAAYAVQPMWYNWVIPLVGALGVWLGGRRRNPAGSGGTPRG